MVLVAFGVAIAGCSGAPPPPYEQWVTKSAFAPNPNSGNAFDGYVLCSRQASEAAHEYASFTSFERRHKLEIIKLLGPAVSKLAQAARLTCDFRFMPHAPDEPDSDFSGMRFLRYSVVWQIQNAVEARDFGHAVQLSLLANKVGSDFLGGGSIEADIGLQWMDQSRSAIADAIPEMTTSQLSQLTSGLKKALSGIHGFDPITRNETQNFLAGVQWLQDHYREGTLAEVDDFLGSSVRDATTYLKAIPMDDRSKRPAYFKGFADEAHRWADWYSAQGALPAAKRKSEKEMPVAEERPWKRYAAALFTTLRPILERYDRTIARTRLAILTSEVQRQIKISHLAPKTLNAFSQELILDPYSGVPLKYRAEGADYYIYSVGQNLQDDQGATDTIFESPDLTLESSNR